MNPIRWTLAFAVLVGCSVISGCGGGAKYYPVEGVVTVDNEPLEGAMVHFTSDTGVAASGMTNANGKFKLITGSNDGVPAGTYKVMVKKAPAQQADNNGSASGEDMRTAYQEYLNAQNAQKKEKKAGKAPEKSAIPERYLKPGAIPDQIVPAAGPVSIELSSKDKKK
jgi:hypothetical protein